MAVQHLLLVEGDDDKHVFWGLLQHHDFPEVFKVEERGGIDNLLASLRTQLKASDLERLGIVVDADTDLAKRWGELTRILTKAGYTPPASPDSAGTIIPPPRAKLPTVGIWLMPNNRLPGMLEDFIAFLVPVSDPLWQKAQDDVAAIPEPRRFGPRLSKANIHTWLAWQEDPGTPLGFAITKRYLTADTPEVHPLLDWLRRLFL